MTDTETVKKYALVSYIKLLTTRVLRLEEEMRLQKKTSVVVVNRLNATDNEQEAQQMIQGEDSFQTETVGD